LELQTLLDKMDGGVIAISAICVFVFGYWVGVWHQKWDQQNVTNHPERIE
jgi:hypothetical protein